MAYVPIASSDDLVSSSLFAGIKQTGDLKGLYESAAKLVTTDPVVDLYRSMQSASLKGHGQFLTPEQIKAQYPSAYKKYAKSGGYEGEVAYDNNIISSHNMRTDLVNNMDSGFLAGASKFAGAAIGMALSPTTIAASAATAGVGGFVEDAVVNSEKMSDLINSSTHAQRAYKAGVGAVEGGTVMLPSASGEDFYRKYAGDKHVHMLGDLGYAFVQGAALGAVIKTAVGHVPMMDPSHGKAAIETATRQMEAGDKLSVDKLIQQGHYEASKSWLHTPEEIQKSLDDIKPVDDKLALKQADIETKIQDHKNSLSEPVRHDEAVAADSYKSFVKNNDLEDSFKMKELYSTSSRLDRSLDDIKEKRSDLETVAKNTELYKQMVMNKPKPIEQSDLLRDVEKVGKPENQVTFDTRENEKSNEIMKSTSNIYQKEDMSDKELGNFLDIKNQELDGFVKDAKLSNEAQDMVDESDFEGKRHDVIAKALSDYKECRSAG